MAILLIGNVLFYEAKNQELSLQGMEGRLTYFSPSPISLLPPLTFPSLSSLFPLPLSLTVAFRNPLTQLFSLVLFILQLFFSQFFSVIYCFVWQLQYVASLSLGINTALNTVPCALAPSFSPRLKSQLGGGQHCALCTSS